MESGSSRSSGTKRASVIAQLIGDLAAGQFENVAEHEARAFPGAGARDRASNAARGSGDDDRAALEHPQTAVRTEAISSAASWLLTCCDSMRRMRATPTSCW